MGGAFAAGAWIDFFALQPAISQTSSAEWIYVRHLQAMCIGMGLLQLVFQEFLELAGELTFRRMLAGLTMLGGAALYLLGALPYATAEIGILGTGILLLGFAAQSVEARRVKNAYPLPQIALLLAWGMGIHLLLALVGDYPEQFRWAELGPPEGLRLRMLRLGQMAAIALPVLAFLYEGIAEQETQHQAAMRWGRIGLLTGAAGMPLILVLAAFFSYDIKYLLTLPVGATVLGTWVAAWLAGKTSRSEAGFWILVGLSMAVGQWMGTFAFDGPMAAPVWMQDYLTASRRVIRLAHTYGIMLGIAGIFFSRRAVQGDELGITKSGLFLYSWGTIFALTALAVATWTDVTGWVLATGPAIVALGIATNLISFRVAARK